MTDPLGLIHTTPVSPTTPKSPVGVPGQSTSGPSFRQTLESQIEQVNQLQQDAKVATEDLMTGRRDDVETVIQATQKADMAFRMLLQLRNKVMDAYEEVKQIRV